MKLPTLKILKYIILGFALSWLGIFCWHHHFWWLLAGCGFTTFIYLLDLSYNLGKYYRNKRPAKPLILKHNKLPRDSWKPQITNKLKPIQTNRKQRQLEEEQENNTGFTP